MSNLETLQAAGVVPADHTLSAEDAATIEVLTAEEVALLISLKQKLGEDFVQRNTRDAANCII